MKFSQSQFQDTFFVAGSQITPFRRLRQIKMEIYNLEDSIKKSELNARRLELKLKKLDPVNEEDAIDIEEHLWDRERQKQMLDDAVSRLDNFKLMEKQLLESIPQDYWDAGFENAELEHWTKHVAKQIGMAKAMGLPPPASAVEMWMQLPEHAQYDALALCTIDTAKMISMNQQVIEQLQSPSK